MNMTEEIKASIGNGVRVHRDGRLSTLLADRFNFASGRIDWTKAKGVSFRKAPVERAAGANHSETGFCSSDYVLEVLKFINSTLAEQGCPDSTLALVTDSIEEEFEVEREALPELLKAVAEIPDHKYVFPIDGSWCIMWTFEDDLYFGFSDKTSSTEAQRSAGP